MQRVLDALDPNPAFVRGRRYDILGWNRGAIALMGDYATMHPKARNILWRFFMEETFRSFFIRQQDVAQKLTAQFRAVAARYPDDPSFAELIDELVLGSPAFREYWARHDVQASYEGYKHLRHPIAGDLVLEYSTLQIPDHPDMRVAIYTPDNEDSRRKVHALVHGTHAASGDDTLLVR